MSIDPVPTDDYLGVCPYLTARDPEAALAFYKDAFGAEERMRLKMPDGAIAHAEVKIGTAVVMLSGEWPDAQQQHPARLGGTTASFCVYVPDVDALAARAEAAGAEIVSPPETKFYGDRSVTLRDIDGYLWSFMSRVEAITPEELQARMSDGSSAT